MPPAPRIEGPRDTRILEDGRAGVVWAIDGDGVFVLFERDGERWLVDDLIAILEAGTPAP